MRRLLLGLAVLAALCVAAQATCGDFDFTDYATCQTASQNNAGGCYWQPTFNACYPGTCTGETDPTNCVSQFDCIWSNGACSPWQPFTCASASDEPTCYEHRDLCHFEPYSSVCIDGAPAGCSSFYRDTTGCNANAPGCGINAFNGQCYGAGQLSVQVSATPACAAETTSNNCTAANCFWDSFLPTAGLCTASPAESETFAATATGGPFSACEFWSNYAQPAACTNHGCASVGANLCAEMPPDGASGPIDTEHRASLNFSYTLLNPTLQAGTLDFSATLQVPLAQYFNPDKPMWHSVWIGTGPSDPSAPFVSSACNSLYATYPAFTTGQPVIDPVYAPGHVTLQTEFLGTTDLDFSALGSDTQEALYDTVGHSVVGSSTVLHSVTFPTSYAINLNAGFNARWAAANCAGSTQTQVNDDRVDFVLPVTLCVVQDGIQACATNTVPYIVLPYGTVMMGATDQDPKSYTFKNVVDPLYPSDPNLARREWDVAITYRTTDATRVLGLRSLSDVSMVQTIGGAQVIDSPTNCFGTTPVSVTAPTGFAQLCPGSATQYCWTSTVHFQTRYTYVQTDGNSLNQCQYQSVVDHDTEMSAGVPYASELDGKQDFFVGAKSWPVGHLADGPFTNVGSDGSGVLGDPILISISKSTLPAVGSSNVQFASPVCGFSTSPSANTPEQMIVPTQTVGDFVIDLRNSAASGRLTLFIACWIADPVQRNVYTFHFEPTNPDFEVVAIDSLGVPVVGVTPMPGTRLSAFMTHATRDQVGQHAPWVVSTLGVDEFGVLQSAVYDAMPSLGFAYQMPWHIQLPLGVTGGAFIPEGAVNRRLFSLSSSSSTGADGSGSNTTAAIGSSTVIVYLPMAPQVEAGANLGSAAQSGQMATGVMYALFGALAVATVGGSSISAFVQSRLPLARKA